MKFPFLLDGVEKLTILMDKAHQNFCAFFWVLWVISGSR